MLLLVRFSHPAGVMELADVPDSKSGGSNTVRVRPPPPAPARFLRAFIFRKFPPIFPLSIDKSNKYAIISTETTIQPERIDKMLYTLLTANPMTGQQIDYTLVIISGVAVVACIAAGIIAKIVKNKKK